MSKQESERPCCPPSTVTPESGDLTGAAQKFKALGDPVRLRMLALIAAGPGGEACVCEISTGFELSQPTISHHLKVLREAGLLDCERRGTWVYYWISPGVLAELSALLIGHLPLREAESA